MLENFGPVNHHCEEGRRWWSHFEPHLKPWLREEVLSGRVDEPTLADFGAFCLISSGETRGLDANFEAKESYCWEGMDGHELLFDGLGEGGLPEGWEAHVVVDAMRSFAAYLGQRGALDAATAAHLVRELDTWGPRFVRYWDDDGPWYYPDGTVRVD